jgi:hypothetical protein
MSDNLITEIKEDPPETTPINSFNSEEEYDTEDVTDKESSSYRTLLISSIENIVVIILLIALYSFKFCCGNAANGNKSLSLIKKKQTKVESFNCKHCSKTCKSKPGLASHERSCANK